MNLYKLIRYNAADSNFEVLVYGFATWRHNMWLINDFLKSKRKPRLRGLSGRVASLMSRINPPHPPSRSWCIPHQSPSRPIWKGVRCAIPSLVKRDVISGYQPLSWVFKNPSKKPRITGVFVNTDNPLGRYEFGNFWHILEELLYCCRWRCGVVHCELNSKNLGSTVNVVVRKVTTRIALASFYKSIKCN